MHKQNRNRLLDTESRLVVTRGEECWGSEWGSVEKIKFNLAVTKQASACKVQHRKCSQKHCDHYVWCQLGTGNIEGNTTYNIRLCNH